MATGLVDAVTHGPPQGVAVGDCGHQADPGLGPRRQCPGQRLGSAWPVWLQGQESPHRHRVTTTGASFPLVPPQPGRVLQ